MSKRKLLALAPITTALCLTFPGVAMANAGKAIFVIGKVNVLNEEGVEQRIRRGGEVDPGDTIITTDRSHIQIRMNDGTLLAVRPNSTFRVDDYTYNQDIDNDKSHYSLVKGGMRSITGAMGKENKSSYQVNTIVGTIGIRGTDFSARLCSADCVDADDGLYVGVMEGAVVLSNDSGELDVLPGDFGFMQDQNIEPDQLEVSPGELLFAHTDTETHTEVASTTTDSSVIGTTDTVEATSIESTDTNPEVVAPITTTNGENLLAVSDLSELILPDDTIVGSEDTTNTTTDPIDTGIVLPTSGTAVYQTISSNGPTDGVTTGTLNTVNTHLTVNFTNPSATAQVNADFNGVNWTGDTVAAMDILNDGSFSGDLYVTAADIFSTQTGNGTLSGSLSGIPESTISAPSDANMTYSMTAGSTTLTGDVTLGVSNTAP